MIEIPVHNDKGEQVDTLSLDEQALGGEVRFGLLKQAYVRCHANRRQGTAATKSRGMVEGSTRKLYRQKGTGNARRGAIRTNIMRGGGVAFGKKPKSWRMGMPKKMRRLANRNAILAKAVDNEFKLIDGVAFDKPSTREFASLLDALKIDRSCLLATGDTQDAASRSARNLDHVTVTRIDQLNVFDVLNHRFLLADRQGFEQWLQSQTNGREKPAPAQRQTEATVPAPEAGQAQEG